MSDRVSMAEVNRVARRQSELHDTLAELEAQIHGALELLRSLNTGGHYAVQHTLGDHEHRINQLEAAKGTP